MAQPAFGADVSPQNVTVIVAFPAGGIADVIARLVAQKLESASSTASWSRIAAAPAAIWGPVVATAAPDGYTLLATTTSLAVN